MKRVVLFEANPASLTAHPAAAMFPRPSDDELDALADDIALHGQMEPIDTVGFVILDGLTRAAACQRAGILVRCRECDLGALGFSTAAAFVLSRNIRRRHLTDAQRAAVAAQAARLHAEELRAAKSASASTASRGSDGQFTAPAEAGVCRIRDTPVPPSEATDSTDELGGPESCHKTGRAADAAAKAAGATVRSVRMIAGAPDDVIAAVRDGKANIDQAVALARLDEEQRSKLIGGVLPPAKQITATAKRDKVAADLYGRALPGKIGVAFSDARDALRDMVALIETISDRWEAMRGSQPYREALHGMPARTRQKLTMLAELASELRDARPASLCCYCRGQGATGGPTCRWCGNSGWITEDALRSAPRQIREFLEIYKEDPDDD